MNIHNLVSPQLRAALRQHGWAKLAHAVLYKQGGFPPGDTSLREGARALCMKLAVDRVNQSIVRDGIAAYKELHNAG